MSVPRSKITWTDFSGGDANFVLRGRAAGDCEASAGCANCYAAAILRRSGQTPEHTTWNGDKLLRLTRAKFEPGDTPFRRGPGSKPLVFVCDMGDLLHDAVPTTFILQALFMMADRQDVEWQVLTKRAERLAYIGERYFWPANVWAGVSVENQQAADERIPLLVKVPARVRFLSCEPLLGPVQLYPHMGITGGGIKWVIVGGESGPKRRRFDPAWARNILEACRYAYRVAFFYKQSGGLQPGTDAELDGVVYHQFPVTGSL